MTTLSRATVCTAPARRRTGPLALLLRLDATFRQRRALADLPPHRLADLGLGAEEAAREAARPVWDAPAHWRA